jgi:transposase-like protein
MLARKRKHSTEWERRDVVERWKASGLSQAEFCRQENISEWMLSAWKRREFQIGAASGPDAPPKSQTPDQYGPPPKAGKQLVSYWRRVIRQQAESGLSGPDFCRAHGIKIRTFNRWLRKFAREQRASHKSLMKENPFVAVHVPMVQAEPAVDSEIEIVLAGGSIVRVTERTPLALLARTLRALEATC